MVEVLVVSRLWVGLLTKNLLPTIIPFWSTSFIRSSLGEARGSAPYSQHDFGLSNPVQIKTTATHPQLLSANFPLFRNDWDNKENDKSRSSGKGTLGLPQLYIDDISEVKRGRINKTNIQSKKIEFVPSQRQVQTNKRLSNTGFSIGERLVGQNRSLFKTK